MTVRRFVQELEIIMSSRTSRNIRPGMAFFRAAVVVAVGATLVSGIALASRPAIAQSASLPRADVVEQLGAQYAETQAAVGVTDEGGVIEVFTTDDGSTWTLVLTTPDGTSRVIAAGETWIKR